MAFSLANLQDLRTVLGQLDAERPAVQEERFGRTLYEPRGDDFLKWLELDLSSRRGKSRVLVTGQIGVGKSSELRRFFYVAKRGRHLGRPVYCDLEKQESPERCGATGVLLTMLRDCWSELDPFLHNFKNQGGRALAKLLSIRDEILSRLIDHLNGELRDEGNEVVFRFGGMDFGVSIAQERKNQALALILGKAAQHEAVSKPAERFGVAPDTLVGLLNQLLRWMSHNKPPPTLIVDHVDKIRDPSSAEDVLVGAFTHWNRIEASIIMTAPFEFTLGDLRNSVESRWSPPRVLFPVEIPQADEGTVPSIYRNIAKNAGLSKLLPDDSMRLLAHYSGGILRTYVQFLIAACKEAHFAGHDQIEPTDALTVVHAAQRAYQDYSVDDLKLLDEVTGSGTGLRNAMTLLRSPIGLLVTKDKTGEQVLRPHPLANRALERMHLKSIRLRARIA